jgi:protease-4
MGYSLIKDIFTGIWALDHDAAIGFAPQVSQILEGHELNHGEYELEAYALPLSGGDKREMRMAPQNSVAVIPFEDVLYKKDMESGPDGLMTKAMQIEEAAEMPNIVGIMLKIDSPGGSADGPQLIQQSIAKAKDKTTKPIMAYVCGEACSAAYWIASQADEIYANSVMDRIGSIGTMATFVDVKPYLEAQGYNVIEEYATRSTNKNGAIRQAMQGDTEKLRTEELDPINQQFISAVQDKRPNILNGDTVFSGEKFYANTALQNGMIDGLNDMEDVIERIRSAAQEAGVMIPETVNNNQNATNMEFAAIAALLGVEGFSTDEQGHYTFTQDQLNTINEQLSTLNTQNTTLQGQLEEYKQANEAYEAEREAIANCFDEAPEDLAKTVEQRVEESEKYRSMDGASKTAVPKAKDEVEPDTTAIDDLPHNKEADQVL